jgi:hypothetical protein
MIYSKLFSYLQQAKFFSNTFSFFFFIIINTNKASDPLFLFLTKPHFSQDGLGCNAMQVCGRIPFWRNMHFHLQGEVNVIGKGGIDIGRGPENGGSKVL